MNSGSPVSSKWTESSSAPLRVSGQSETMFKLLFERSADAIFLQNPATGRFVDCNQAALDLMRARNKEQLLNLRPEELAPPCQADGTPSDVRAGELSAVIEERGGYRFEWLARRLDGQAIPLEVVITVIASDADLVHVVVARDISERQQAEQALIESQRLLSSVADNIPDAIYRSGPDHKLYFVNNAYLRMFGYGSLAEIQAIPRERLYADAEVRRQLLNLLKHEGGFANQEVEYVRRDGTRFWGLSSSRAIRVPESGELLYYVGAIVDVTLHKRDAAEIVRLNQSLERRIAERTSELSASEARLRTIVEHAPEAIVVFDGDTGQFLFGNAPACRIYGCNPEDLPRLSPWAVSPEFQPDGTPSWLLAKRKIGEALRGGMPVFEFLHRHSSGNLVSTEVRLVRLPGDGRNLVRASIMDVTERNKADQALRDSEAKYRALFAASTQGVMLHDEHRYLEVNPAALRILGYSSQEEILGLNPGHTSPEFQPDGSRSTLAAAQHIQDCLARGSTRFDWVAESADGRPIPLNVILTRVQWGGRQIIQAVIDDISERKKAEEELLKALAHERELGQLKSSFVSMVSHEFRTPLGIIISSAEILDAYFDQLDPAERREQLQSIQKNTKRMARMMEDVLLLGMAEAGRMEFKPRPVDFISFCRRTIEDLRSACDSTQVIRFGADALPVVAAGDERLLSHIFTNLLSNAVKYSPPGSTIDFKVQQHGEKAICHIRDQGVGIPEKDLSRLFQAFQRGGNVQHVAGTGLGLSIVKRCVDLHQGSIYIESQPGQGTTVTVELPLFKDL